MGTPRLGPAPGRPYTVTPTLKRKVYAATFRDATGERVTRSLRTSDLATAEAICSQLRGLWIARARYRGQVRGVSWAPIALQLYFGAGAAVDKTAGHPEKEAEKDIGAAFEGSELLDVQSGLLERIARLEADLAAEREAHEALRASAIGRAAEAAAQCPPLDASLQAFSEHMRATTSDLNARNVVSVAQRFLASLPQDIRTAAQVTAGHVGQWLDEQATGDKRHVRRKNMRIRLGRFLRWSAQQYGIPCVMDAVAAPRGTQIARSGSDIHWHTLADVEAAVDAQADAYWRAVVATLGYAGLQLAELAFLRLDDLDLDSARPQLWITPHAAHALKTGHRRRSVGIHATYLLPRLRAHLDAGGAGDTYVFPRRGPRRSRQVDGEHWRVDTLGKQLIGWDAAPRKPAKAGRLPDGMTAMSLRRTFGSLLLRSGRSAEEVAAAMGNTAAVVRQHYARIVGCEVDVDF